MKSDRRPLRRSLATRRIFLGFAFAAGLAGCANPNFIGVQDFGYIVGNVVDAGGKPIPNALVSVTGTDGPNGSGNTGPTGGFNIQKVAAGEQTITVTAVGYSQQAPVTVIVVKDQGVQAGNIVMQSVLPAQ